MVYSAPAYRRLKHFAYIAQRQLKCGKADFCHLQKLVGQIPFSSFFEYVINIIRLLLCGGDSLVKVSRLAVDASVDVIAYFLIDFYVHYLHCLHHSAHIGQHIGDLFALFDIKEAAASAA